MLLWNLFLSFILNKPRRTLHKFYLKVIGRSFEHQSTGTVAARVSFAGGFKGSAVPNETLQPCRFLDFWFYLQLLVHIIRDLKVREGLHHFQARYNTVNELKNRGINGKKTRLVCVTTKSVVWMRTMPLLQELNGNVYHSVAMHHVKEVCVRQHLYSLMQQRWFSCNWMLGRNW